MINSINKINYYIFITTILHYSMPRLGTKYQIWNSTGFLKLGYIKSIVKLQA